MSRFRDASPLELAYDRAIRDLRNHEITSEEYTRKLEVVIKLHKMISEDKSSSVSKDTMAVIGANLLGLIMIIKHEQFNIINTRLMTWIIKPFTRL